MTVRPLSALVRAVAILLLLVVAAPALLRAEDAKPAAGKNLLKPTNVAANWRLENQSGKATMTVDGDAVVFDVTETGTEEWHIQAVQTGFDLTEGKEYILTLKAKASAPRSMTVNAMVDQEDWHTIGLTETADLTTEWQDLKYEFKAEQVAKDKNRVTFVLGNATGKVWLKDVTLTAK